MSTRAIAATKEQIANTETYVSSALTIDTQVYLPKINDGSGSTVSVGTAIRVQSASTGQIEVLTLGGRRLVLVRGHPEAVLIPRAGHRGTETEPLG